MKKLGAVIHYECITSFKYIWIFYAIEFSIVALLSVLIMSFRGSDAGIGTKSLEINTLVYVGILGALGFRSDFRILLQNGFTRKQIFGGTVSMFAFVSGIMALVDTLTGQILHRLIPNFDSLFGDLYGYEKPLANWLWLFLLYMLVCCLLYLVLLIINRIGVQASVVLGLILGLVHGIALPALVFLLPPFARDKIIGFGIRAFGFMKDGSIHLANPVLLFLMVTGVFCGCGYLVIRRAELKK